jgi:putative SOS response-associated peptidase YedK
MAKLHDRMPAILAPAEYDAWLRDGDLDLAAAVWRRDVRLAGGQGAAEGP